MGYTYVNPIMWALAISLSTFAGVWTFFAWRNRRMASVVRGLGLVVLPFGLLFTGTLTLAMRIIDAVTLWATRLVFSPMMWVGVVLVAVSLALLAGGRALERRIGHSAQDPAGPSALPSGIGRSKPAAPVAADPVDAEMAEIEAILRKRGIG